MTSKRAGAISIGVVVAGAITVVGFTVASASTGTSGGVTVCVGKASHAIVSPTATGTCAKNHTPVVVADQNSVDAAKQSITSLQDLASKQYQGSIGGGDPAGGPAGGTTSTYTVPAGVHELRVELWGGGGGGQGTTDLYPSAGAQGSYLHAVVNVTPGDTCTVVVGNGGAPNFTADYTPAQNGGDSKFSCSQNPATLDVTGGTGGTWKGADDPPGSQDGTVQIYAGQSSVYATPGGLGFPATGGVGRQGSPGDPGSPGLALIAPVG